MPIYLVERYWPGVTPGLLRQGLSRCSQVMEEMGGRGTRIRDISCTLIPGEEVVFSVYEGPSELVIRQLNERAGMPVSRIVAAVAVTEDHVGW